MAPRPTKKSPGLPAPHPPPRPDLALQARPPAHPDLSATPRPAAATMECMAQMMGGKVGLRPGLDRLAVPRQLERDELVRAVEVPAVVRRGLEGPLDLAAVGVDGEGGAGPLVVAGPDPAVPGARVAGADVEQVELRVVGAAEPGGAAAGLPGVAGPGLVERAGHGRRLAVQAADIALDGRPVPHLLAGVGVVGLDGAGDAELAARVADDHLALDDQRGGRVGVPVLVLLHLLVPDDLARLPVEGDEVGVERREVDLVLVERGTAVDDVAAGQDALGQP